MNLSHKHTRATPVLGELANDKSIPKPDASILELVPFLSNLIFAIRDLWLPPWLYPLHLRVILSRIGIVVPYVCYH